MDSSSPTQQSCVRILRSESPCPLEREVIRPQSRTLSLPCFSHWERGQHSYLRSFVLQSICVGWKCWCGSLPPTFLFSPNTCSVFDQTRENAPELNGSLFLFLKMVSPLAVEALMKRQLHQKVPVTLNASCLFLPSVSMSGGGSTPDKCTFMFLFYWERNTQLPSSQECHWDGEIIRAGNFTADDLFFYSKFYALGTNGCWWQEKAPWVQFFTFERDPETHTSLDNYNQSWPEWLELCAYSYPSILGCIAATCPMLLCKLKI